MTDDTVARPTTADKLLSGLAFADRMAALAPLQGRIDLSALIVSHTLEALPPDTPVREVLALLSSTDLAALRGLEQ